MATPVSPPLDPATGQPVNLYPEKTPRALFLRPFDEVRTNVGDNVLQAIARDSAFNIDDNYRQVFSDPSISWAGKAAYVAGRVANDLVVDGSRRPWWMLNHPMAQTAIAGDIASEAAGLSPDYGVYAQQLEGRGLTPTREAIDEAFAEDMGFSYRGSGVKGIPLGLARNLPHVLGASAMLAASGNTDFLNVAGGGRTPGFSSVITVEGNPTASQNPLLELGARYFFGRTGKLLPWEQFTAERPDVSPVDYDSYRAYQNDKGPLMGLIKGTSRNIDGEPEYGMMGFRVPLSAAATTAGGLAGVVAGSKIADAAVNQAMVERMAPALRTRGNRRLAGAALGGLLGAITGRIGSGVVNDAIIQPTLNPEAVVAAQAWRQQQAAQGLL